MEKNKGVVYEGPFLSQLKQVIIDRELSAKVKVFIPKYAVKENFKEWYKTHKDIFEEQVANESFQEVGMVRNGKTVEGYLADIHVYKDGYITKWDKARFKDVLKNKYQDVLQKNIMEWFIEKALS